MSMDPFTLLKSYMSRYIPCIEKLEVDYDSVVVHTSEYRKLNSILRGLVEKGIIKNYDISTGVVRVVPSIRLVYDILVDVIRSSRPTYGYLEEKRGTVVLDIGVITVRTKTNSLIRPLMVSEVLHRSFLARGFESEPILILDDMDRDFSILLWTYDKNIFDLMPPHILVPTLKIFSEIRKLKRRIEELKQKGLYNETIKLLGEIDRRVAELVELRERYGSTIDKVIEVAKRTDDIEAEWNTIYRSVLRGSYDISNVVNKIRSNLDPLFKFCRLDVKIVSMSKILVHYRMLDKLVKALSQMDRVKYTERGVELYTFILPGRFIVLNKDGVPTGGIRRLLVDLWLLEHVHADNVLMFLSRPEGLIMSRVVREMAHVVKGLDASRLKLVEVGRVRPDDADIKSLMNIIGDTLESYEKVADVLRLSLVIKKRTEDLDLRDKNLLIESASLLHRIVDVEKQVKLVKLQQSNQDALPLALLLLKFPVVLEELIEHIDPRILVLYLKKILEELYSLVEHQDMGRDLLDYCVDVIKKSASILGVSMDSVAQ